MRHQGKITKWIDEKGYGFITADSGQQVFVHIKSFKKIQRNPVVGDIITYEVADDSVKGPQAYNIQYPYTSKTHNKRLPPKKPTRDFKLLYIIVIVMILLMTWQKFKLPEKNVLNDDLATPLTSRPMETFQCSGKTKCGEMTSCEEATFYLKHCPGTIADGDGDGIPCEDQWCGH